MFVDGVPFLTIEMWSLLGEPQLLLETAYGKVQGGEPFLCCVWAFTL